MPTKTPATKKELNFINQAYNFLENWYQKKHETNKDDIPPTCITDILGIKDKFLNQVLDGKVINLTEQVKQRIKGFKDVWPYLFKYKGSEGVYDWLQKGSSTFKERASHLGLANPLEVLKKQKFKFLKYIVTNETRYS